MPPGRRAVAVAFALLACGCGGDLGGCGRAGSRTPEAPEPAPALPAHDVPEDVPEDEVAIVQMSAGIYAHCYVLETGELHCTGGDVEHVPEIADAVEVSLEEGRGCVRHRDGRVRCFALAHSSSTELAVDDVVALASGAGHTCALRSDGTVWCWGGNGSGQLGDRTLRDRGVVARPVARPVEGLSGIAQVTAGYVHTCAREPTGRVLCWGSNHRGQLGRPGGGWSATPVPVAGVADAVEIASGFRSFQTCARRRDGSVVCWGAYGFDSGGYGGEGCLTRLRERLVTLPQVPDVAEVHVGNWGVCARDREGRVLCWDKMDEGCTRAVPVTYAPAERVAELPPVAELDLGGLHRCARTTARIFCWGALGREYDADLRSPTLLPGLPRTRERGPRPP